MKKLLSTLLSVLMIITCISFNTGVSVYADSTTEKMAIINFESEVISVDSVNKTVTYKISGLNTPSRTIDADDGDGTWYFYNKASLYPYIDENNPNSAFSTYSFVLKFSKSSFYSSGLTRIDVSNDGVATITTSSDDNFMMIVYGGSVIHSTDNNKQVINIYAEGLGGTSTTVGAKNGNELNSDGTRTVYVSTPTVSSIAIKSAPTKTTYNVGDSLDLTGAQITVTKSDSSTEDKNITSDMVSGFDSSTAGTKTVTVTYEEKTATFDVTVNSSSPTTITTPLDFTNANTCTAYANKTNGVQWDNDTKTLTLDGATIDCSGTTADSSSHKALILPDGATIVTTAASSVKAGSSTYNQVFGIYCDGSLNFEGSGTLTITTGTAKSNNYAIGTKCIAIKSGAVISATAGSNSDGTSIGINSDESLTNNGTITAKGSSMGIGVKSITNSGTMTADGKIGVMLTGGSLTVTSGTIKAKGSECAVYSTQAMSGLIVTGASETFNDGVTTTLTNSGTDYVTLTAAGTPGSSTDHWTKLAPTATAITLDDDNMTADTAKDKIAAQSSYVPKEHDGVVYAKGNNGYKVLQYESNKWTPVQNDVTLNQIIYMSNTVSVHVLGAITDPFSSEKPELYFYTDDAWQSLGESNMQIFDSASDTVSTDYLQIAVPKSDAYYVEFTTISGVTKAVTDTNYEGMQVREDALGKYVMTVKLNSGYTWDDGSTDDLTYSLINIAGVKGNDKADVDQGINEKTADIIMSVIDKLENAFNSFNGDASTTANPTITDVLGTGSYIDVELKSIAYDTKAASITSESDIVTYVFDVTPYKGSEAQHALTSNVTFRLPVEISGYTYANVYHGSTFIGQKTIGTESGLSYVEISAKDFSEYSYTLTNTKYVAPSGDGGGSGGGESGNTYKAPNTAVR